MIILLTLITQVGGMIWSVVFLFYFIVRRKAPFYVKFASFLAVYTFSVFSLVPYFAQKNNKVPLPSSRSGVIVPHNALFVLSCRNYVSPEMYELLQRSGERVQEQNPNLKLVYLDASFPFLDQFSMPPHFSHNNGKKVDLSFAYRQNGKLTNRSSSFTGYGHYIEPEENEYNMPKECAEKGYKQYDFSQYAAFKKYTTYEFDMENTRDMIMTLLANPQTQLIFLEPHLQQRLEIQNSKVRPAGCHAVRHDDHLHYQIR